MCFHMWGACGSISQNANQSGPLELYQHKQHSLKSVKQISTDYTVYKPQRISGQGYESLHQMVLPYFHILHPMT